MRNQRTDILPRLALAGLALLATLLLSAPLALASEGCPNEAVRRESNVAPATGRPYSQGLPECRAYEMVSPLEKGGSSVLSGARQGFPVAADGNAAGFLSQNAFGDAENAAAGAFGAPDNSYIARRAASGWGTSSAFAPRGLIGTQDLHADASPEDLSTVVNCGLTVINNSGAGSHTVCTAHTPDGPWLSTPDYSTLTGQPYNNFTGNAAIEFVGSSSDLSHVVFITKPEGEGIAFLPTDTSTFNGDGIYEVAGLGGAAPELRLVNVDDSGSEIGPNEASHVGGVSSQTGEAIPCAASSVSPAVSSSYHAISADGQTIYFTACPSNENGGVNDLYARIDGRETVALSSPSPSQCTTCSPTPASAAFEGASVDGSKAFFLTSRQLVDADTDTSADLYEYDFDNPPGKNLVQLSAGGAGDLTPGAGAEVQDVVRTSSDGSHVYFVAKGVLTTVPNAAGEVAHAGAENLYAVDTAGDETRFVADLCSDASKSGSVGDSQCPASLNGATFEGTNDRALWECLNCLSGRMAQTTPDGRYLVFTTYARLLAAGPEADTSEAQQVYRYDFATGKLARISIGEPSFPASANGNTPGMDATITGLESQGADGDEEGALADVNDWARAVSDDGAIIVFSTPERLQADDTNTGANPGCRGETGCNVYVWQECSGGACEDGMQGEVGMISPGDDPTTEDTNGGVAAMSASGSDIFLFTHTQLVGQDTDQLGDLYDARIDGGFPAPTREASCSGEACQGAQSPSPVFGVPGSQSFAGGGNQTAPPFKEVLEPEAKPGPTLGSLTRALAKCRKDRQHTARRRCERSAQRRYGAKQGKAKGKQ
jgi:hypothetical protein